MPTESVTSGTVFTVQVSLAHAARVGAFETALTFDPAQVAVASVELAPGLALSGREFVLMTDSGNPGLLKTGAYSMGDVDADSQRSLVVVQLRAIVAGVPVLKIADTTVTDAHGTALTVDGVRVFVPLVVQ